MLQFTGPLDQFGCNGHKAGMGFGQPLLGAGVRYLSDHALALRLPYPSPRQPSKRFSLHAVPDESTQRKVFIQGFPVDADAAADRSPFAQLRGACLPQPFKIGEACL